MKSQTIFNATLIVLLTFFWSCNGEPNTAATNNTIKKDIEMLCKEDRDGTITQQISKTCAKTSIDAYAKYIETLKISLPPIDSTYNEARLIRGAKINRAELLRIAVLLKRDTSAVPFIMLALKEDDLGVYTDMILTIESEDSTSIGDASYKYFDFTQPCPHACPDLYLDYIEE